MPQPAQKPGLSKQDYATPLEFVTAVKRRWQLEQFAHDFAADSTNAKAPTFFDARQNALLIPRWERLCSAGWGWLNPPFADIRPWAYRCLETSQQGGSIMFLVPAAVGSNWYRDFIHRKALVLALNGRLPFMVDKPDWLYPKDCILCLFSPNVQPDFDVWTWKGSSDETLFLY